MSIPRISPYALPTAAELPANRVAWQVEPARAVLLVHDMQDYFLRYYGDDSPLLGALLRNVARALAWARAHRVPVLYTAQPGEQAPRDRALLNDMWGAGLTTADPALQAIAAAVAPLAGETVLTKWRYSAFQRSPLHELMQGWGRDQMVICGVYAHIGCLATALEAFMRDIQPFMLADAVADFSEDEHRMALRYVAGRCGVVTTVAALPGLPPLPTRADLRRALAACLEDDVDGVGDDANLMDHGLDSVQAMALVAAWRAQGLTVSFEELARRPTLDAWWALLAERQGIAP